MLAPVTAHTILIQRKAAAGLNLLKRLRDWQFPRTIKPPTRLPFRRYQAHLAQNVLSYRNVGHQAQCQGLVVLLIVDSMLRQFNDLPILGRAKVLGGGRERGIIYQSVGTRRAFGAAKPYLNARKLVHGFTCRIRPPCLYKSRRTG